MKKKIYLDYNANAPVFDVVKNELFRANELIGNSSAIHSAGVEVEKKISKSRLIIKDLLNCNDYKIIFTSCGTESNNLILNSFNAQVFVTNGSEHDSVLNSRDDFLFVDVEKSGLINLKDLKKKLQNIPSNQKFLVSVMLINNETGVIQPIKEISHIVHSYGGYIHCDAIQALGKYKLDVGELDVDFATISGHKFGGPLGVSAVIYKKNLILDKFLKGGSQEEDIRAGTQNHVAIISFSKAIEYLESNQYSKLIKSKFGWQNYFENSLLKLSSNIHIFGKDVDRVFNTTQFSIPDIPSENIIIPMDINNIFVSSSSACSSKQKKESHVIQSMGYDKKISLNTVRVSWGWKTKKKELDIFINKLKDILIINNKLAA